MNTNRSDSDRRSSERFPIAQDVRYKALNKRSENESGIGHTINMSSSGVLFTTEQSLSPGRLLELAISWPAQLNNQTPLKLIARGRVMRSEGGQAAIEIQQYEFRTTGKSSSVIV